MSNIKMVTINNIKELKDVTSIKNADVNFYVEVDGNLVSYLPMYHGPIDKYLNEGRLKADCKSWINKEVFKGSVLKK